MCAILVFRMITVAAYACKPVTATRRVVFVIHCGIMRADEARAVRALQKERRREGESDSKRPFGRSKIPQPLIAKWVTVNETILKMRQMQCSDESQSSGTNKKNCTPKWRRRRKTRENERKTNSHRAVKTLLNVRARKTIQCRGIWQIFPCEVSIPTLR